MKYQLRLGVPLVSSVVIAVGCGNDRPSFGSKDDDDQMPVEAGTGATGEPAVVDGAPSSSSSPRGDSAPGSGPGAKPHEDGGSAGGSGMSGVEGGCEPNPCQHGGTCQASGTTYECDCQNGYSGVNCETIDECASDPCVNGTCITRAGTFECDCGTSGYSGELCDVLIENCALSPCDNGGVCSDVDGSRVCDCTDTGATGASCEVDIDECESDPCEHGTCENGVGQYTCDCTGTGYQGTNCELEIDDCQDDSCDPLTTCQDLADGFSCSACPAGYTGTGETGCQNIDDCAPNPCAHGTCLDRVAGYECDCGTTGYTGTKCETLIENCAVSPCENGGTCTDVGASRTCDCTGTGATGESCEVDIDECADNPCAHGTCQNGVGQFTCDCTGTDYQGTKCETKIDDCAGDPCKNGGTCTDGNRSFTCDCSATDFNGPTCETKINDCAGTPCKNGGQCMDGNRSFTCDCSGVDYNGTTCETKINDCAGTPCKNGGQCMDGNRSYTCDCSGTGATGNQCQNDIDDCQSKPCLNGGICTDTGANSFSCGCSGDWSGSVCGNATLAIDVKSYGYYTTLDWLPVGGWAMVGNNGSLGEYRAFLVFAIPDFDGKVASATLRLNHDRYESPQTTETVGVFSVDTSSVSQLGTAGTDWLTVFADLGGGTSYAQVTARASTLGSIFNIPLQNATTAISNARGGDFAFGLADVTLSSAVDPVELVHFLTDDSHLGQLQLVITP